MLTFQILKARIRYSTLVIRMMLGPQLFEPSPAATQGLPYQQTGMRREGSNPGSNTQCSCPRVSATVLNTHLGGIFLFKKQVWFYLLLNYSPSNTNYIYDHSIICSDNPFHTLSLLTLNSILKLYYFI